MPGPATVDEYLAELAPDRRARLQAIRAAARSAAPEAIEVITYAMPGLRSHGRQFLVSYAAFKGHDSLFPASDDVVSQLGDEVAPYLAGRGTIRFPVSEPVPSALIAKIVRIRWSENAKAAAARAADR